MQFHEIRSAPRLRRVVVPLLLAALLAVAGPPSRAEEPANAESGALVELEWWWVTPRNGDLGYAFIDDAGNLSGGGRLVSLEHELAGIARFYAGWQTSVRGAPRIGASFHGYHETSRSGTGSFPDQVGALLASPDFAIGRSLVDSATAESELQTIVVDATIAWSRERPHSRLNLAAGLRMFSFEQRSVVTYDAEDFGQALREIVNAKTEASGLGPFVGVGFEYAFNRRVSLGARVAIALPIGDAAQLTTDTAFIDGIFDRATVVDAPGARRVFTQLDVDLEVRVRLPRGWGLRGAYAFQEWFGIRSGQRFVDALSQNTTVEIRQDVVFEGLLLGASYRF